MRFLYFINDSSNFSVNENPEKRRKICFIAITCSMCIFRSSMTSTEWYNFRKTLRKKNTRMINLVKMVRSAQQWDNNTLPFYSHAISFFHTQFSYAKHCLSLPYLIKVKPFMLMLHVYFSFNCLMLLVFHLFLVDTVLVGCV